MPSGLSQVLWSGYDKAKSASPETEKSRFASFFWCEATFLCIGHFLCCANDGAFTCGAKLFRVF